MSETNNPKQETPEEVAARHDILQIFENIDMPRQELLNNLGLFIKRQNWCRFLFMYELYKKTINTHGVIMEFGVRWGQNLALFSSFRGILEPFNHNRKIVGFDTFGGFPHVHDKDGKHPMVSEGMYSVSQGYEKILERIMEYHERESPIPNIRKFEIVKGDVLVTLDDYLDRHPETIIALAFFDLDIYEPTKFCLERIRPHLTKGSVLGFDQLNHPPFPGETLALKEVLGLNDVRIQRFPFSPTPSFIVVE